VEYYQILRNLREDNDLTQNEIRDYLHLGKNTYNNYENGTREMPFTLVKELSKKYGVSLDYIAGLTNDKGGLHKNNKEEQELLDGFNKLSNVDKGRILGILQSLLEQKETPLKRESEKEKLKQNISIKQINNGKVNIRNK